MLPLHHLLRHPRLRQLPILLEDHLQRQWDLLAAAAIVI